MTSFRTDVGQFAPAPLNFGGCVVGECGTATRRGHVADIGFYVSLGRCCGAESPAGGDARVVRPGSGPESHLGAALEILQGAQTRFQAIYAVSGKNPYQPPLNPQISRPYPSRMAELKAGLPSPQHNPLRAEPPPRDVQGAFLTVSGDRAGQPALRGASSARSMASHHATIPPPRLRG